MPVLVPGNWSIRLPDLNYWFQAAPLFTIGSFFLFAFLGFAGIASGSAAHRKLRIGGYILAFVLFLLGWWQAANQEEASATMAARLEKLANPVQPDITMRLLDPQAPTIQILNPSEAIARTIRYSPLLFNIDADDRDDSLLPIPTGGVDFIRPRTAGQISQLFAPPILAKIKTGNRIFGTIGIQCPECKQGRTFLVHIMWGSGGWFSEVPYLDKGQYIAPKGQRYWDPDYVTFITNMIAPESKLVIKDRDHVDINSP